MVFAGPVRPGTDVEEFRRTGRSVPRTPSRSSRRSRRTPSVSIRGDTVFIDGQGFSVAPNLQAEFIRGRTGGRGSSAQAAINQAANTEKIRLARESIRIKQIERARSDLIRREALLRAQGARITRKKSIDSKTRQRLVITETKLGSEKIRQIRNLDTGDVTINRFGVNGGGSVRFQGGVTTKGKVKSKAPVEIDLAKLSPLMALELDVAQFPVQDLGKRITGLEKISTFTSREATNLLRKLQSKKGLNAKDKAILLALQVAIPSQQLIIGLKQLPSFAKSLVNNPSNIVKVPGQIFTGLKESGLEIISLYKISPALAIARIGGEIITFKAISGGFKVVGKVTGVAAKKISPALKPIKKGSIIAKTTTQKGVIKLRVVTKKVGRTITKKSKAVRVVKRVRKITKAAQKSEVRKFKSAVQYSNELKIARNARKLARKKGRTVSFGNRDFIEGVTFIEDVADKLAKSRAKQFLKKYKAKGGKLGLGKQEDFIRSVQRYVNKNLNEYPAFKNLKNSAKLTEPFQIKLLKTGKIATAKKLVNGIKLKIGRLPFSKQMNSIVKRISRTARKIKKAPGRIKKRMVTKKLQRVARKEFRKTNRYRMQKARKIRKVSIAQLERSQSVNNARRFVDNLFDEVARRQNVKLTSLQYRQFKNTVKKRLSIAVKRGDKVEIKKFIDEARKIINDMNKPINKPTVKIIQKGVKIKRIKTIKDFTPETPKGQYVEVKSGQQVMLQKVKQVPKTKTAQKLVQKQQVFTIQAVQKQTINLMPLLRFGIISLSAQAFKTLSKQKTKQVMASAQISKTLQKVNVAQDIKVLQKVAQATSPKLDVAQAVKQNVSSKLKLKTKQITEKKKVIPRRRFEEKFTKRSIPKKVPVYYIKVKKKGRIVNLLPRPLILRDAKDLLMYKIDRNLVRTAYFEPIGRAKNVVRIPKKMQGYFNKNKRKVRPYKIKVGKKKLLRNGYIEKRRFALDTKREKAQLKKARATKRKRKKK